MRTRYEQMTAGGMDGYHNFIGDDSDYRDWLGCAGRSRDSKLLEESNFEQFRLAMAEADPDENDWRIERYDHWAVGWIEEMYLRPGSRCAEIGAELREWLEQYPVLNEEHLSELESNEADRIWETCFNPSERIEYIRSHRSQFEFRSFGELLDVVRGRYFNGYASELIG